MAKNNEPVSDSDTKTTAGNVETIEADAPAGATPPTDKKPMYEGVTNFAYIGPSLPGGTLKSNTILGGTYAEITEYYKEAIEQYPAVAKLFVPVTRLAESREKAAKGGNLINKIYNEVADAIAEKAKEVVE